MIKIWVIAHLTPLWPFSVNRNSNGGVKDTSLVQMCIVYWFIVLIRHCRNIDNTTLYPKSAILFISITVEYL